MSNRSPAVKRLMKELMDLKNDPCSEFTASPLENDVFEWVLFIYILLYLILVFYSTLLSEDLLNVAFRVADITVIIIHASKRL